MKKYLSNVFKFFSVYFFMLLVITIFILLTLSEYDFMTALYRANFIGVSLVFYLIGFSFALTIITLSYLRSFEKKKLRKVEEGLRMMSEGHYSASIFMNMYSMDTPRQINDDIDRQFLKLHEKLMFMADQALKHSEETKELGNETKEEILEQERHRIARELHDSVSQQLFAASMLLSAANHQTDQYSERVKKQLLLAEKTINASQNEMRALLLHLRPIQLDGKSLKQGIEQLLQELSTKIDINLQYSIESITMPSVMEDNIFRIIQELMSNVLRHAKAKELEIYLRKNGDSAQLKVIDDGIGFDSSKQRAGGYGLQNIKERIEGIGGNVKIVSILNLGTRIEINVPLVTGGSST